MIDPMPRHSIERLLPVVSLATCRIQRLYFPFVRLVAAVLFAAVGFCRPDVFAQEAATPTIRPLPSLSEQAVEQQSWLEARLNRVLPELMGRHEVDLWILSMREYAEDPVFWSFASPTTFAARRRSTYLFHRLQDGSVRRIALGGGSQGGLFEVYKDPDQSVAGKELWGSGQWRLLHDLVTEMNPSSIVLNIDSVHAFSDGLHAGEREALEAALGPELAARIQRVPELAIEFIATRVPEMEDRYRKIQETVHAIIDEAFSSNVIVPGSTTTEDVQWWFREKVRELGMTVWFHPSVSVQRKGEVPEEGPVVIERGDLIWCDFGVVAMRLKTDTQHLGYVLREGEREAPDGLVRGLRASNRLQDILLAEMIPGRTGNQILSEALRTMHEEEISGTIYTHPIGDHGHGAGPLIGLWDRQQPIPGRGELILHPNTWHSIELQATVSVPEWDGKEVSFRQEEEVLIDADGQRHWVYRRQTDFHLID